MSNPEDDLLMREIYSLADKAAEIAPKTIDIAAHAAVLADQFENRSEGDIQEQIKAVLRKRGLF